MIWLSVDDRVHFSMDFRVSLALNKTAADYRDWLLPRLFLYELKDLESLCERIRFFHGLLLQLIAFVLRDRPDELYQALASQSPIREALETLRKKAKRGES